MSPQYWRLVVLCLVCVWVGVLIAEVFYALSPPRQAQSTLQAGKAYIAFKRKPLLTKGVTLEVGMKVALAKFALKGNLMCVIHEAALEVSGLNERVIQFSMEEADFYKVRNFQKKWRPEVDWKLGVGLWRDLKSKRFCAQDLVRYASH